ncbi:MAG: hypothetical protein ACTSRZ_07460 [Promethearchaeota archaeon]
MGYREAFNGKFESTDELKNIPDNELGLYDRFVKHHPLLSGIIEFSLSFGLLIIAMIYGIISYIKG